jgi:hypothetical protein
MATCNTIPDFLRLSYFFGQMLGQNELSTEQRYHRDKHELHNRCLHGHGVVCGLAVTLPPAPLPAEPSVVVECGLAIDPAGHDIVVRTPVTVDLRKSLSAADQARLDDTNGTTLWISVCFQEQKIQPTRPVLPDACGAAPDCMYGMIREGACIVVTIDPPKPDPRCDACCESIPDSVDPCVLLARIDGFKTGQQPAATAIHPEVRRPIGIAAPTVITGINWTHGGSYTASPNAKQLLGDASAGTGGLEIQFSADVRPETIVDGVIDIIRIRPSGEVAYVAGTVAAGATPRSLVFRRDPAGAAIAANDRIQIALHASFVLDMCCRPVDGTHVGGRVPLIAASRRRAASSGRRASAPAAATS